MFVASGVLVLASRALGATARVDRVVWRAGETFYVATSDSGAFAPGMQLCVTSLDREVACGEVTRVLDGVVASVRRTRGDLDAWDGPLASLTVHVSSPGPLVPAALRIGLPAAARSSRAFACTNAHLDPGALPRPYRVDTVAGASTRLVATDTTRSRTDWPDTLDIRLYADRADEEIALERGELDVAVFWPGEAPASLREANARFATLLGERTRGALVLQAAPRDTALAAAAGPDLAAVNRQIFSDDLRPWIEPGAGEPRWKGPPVRITVDPALPGQTAIARVFDARHPPAPEAEARAMRLGYLDVDVANPDSLALAWRPRGILPAFTMRCAVFCRAELAGAVRAFGADRLANLLRCGDAGRPR